METKKENKINIEKIIQAGKAIKAIFTAVLSLIICFIIGFLVATNSTDLDTIKSTYTLIGIVSLLLNFVILYNLYEAGNNLENVTSLQEGDYNSLVEKLNVNTTRTGEFAEGGIIVYTDQNGEHGLVCSKIELGKTTWDEAKKLCENYENDGFNDWRLPNKDELQVIFSTRTIRSFDRNFYWSSTEFNQTNLWGLNFADGDWNYFYKNATFNVCAVRSF
jgi:hypothetical protein